MKTKSISKIMAVIFVLVMTTCLTSCEDESVPAYGTGLQNDGGIHHNLSPNHPAETASESNSMVEGYIRGCGVGYDDEVGEYIWVTAFVTSHYSEPMKVWHIINSVMYGNSEFPYTRMLLSNPPDKSYDLEANIKPGEPTMVTWAFPLPEETDSVVIQLVDTSTETTLDTIKSYLTEE